MRRRRCAVKAPTNLGHVQLDLAGNDQDRSREHPEHGMSFDGSTPSGIEYESDNLCVTPNTALSRVRYVKRERIFEVRPFGIISVRSSGDINLRV